MRKVMQIWWFCSCHHGIKYGNQVIRHVSRRSVFCKPSHWRNWPLNMAWANRYLSFGLSFLSTNTLSSWYKFILVPAKVAHTSGETLILLWLSVVFFTFILLVQHLPLAQPPAWSCGEFHSAWLLKHSSHLTIVTYEPFLKVHVQLE